MSFFLVLILPYVLVIAGIAVLLMSLKYVPYIFAAIVTVAVLVWYFQ